VKLKNNSGLTLVELLVTLTIAFSVMGLVTGVLMQSFRNMEMADTNINLRQEANILLAIINSAHMSSINTSDSRSYQYSISYERINDKEWILTVGDQKISNQNYNIRLEMEQKIPGVTTPTILLIDPIRIYSVTSIPSFEKKLPINIKKLTLISKKDNTKTFELSTIISRL
jgi:hypothetical protein